MDAADVGGDMAIPHGNAYQQLLANPQLKSTFISYLMEQFKVLTCSADLPAHIILDYEDIVCPINIYKGVQVELPMFGMRTGRRTTMCGITA